MNARCNCAAWGSRIWVCLADFADRINCAPEALRKRLQRAKKCVGPSGMEVFDLGNGIFAFRLGRRWRISWPPIQGHSDPHAVTSALSPRVAGEPKAGTP